MGSLKPEERAKVWVEVVQEADGHTVTGGMIRRAVAPILKDRKGAGSQPGVKVTKAQRLAMVSQIEEAVRGQADQQHILELLEKLRTALGDGKGG